MSMIAADARTVSGGRSFRISRWIGDGAGGYSQYSYAEPSWTARKHPFVEQFIQFAGSFLAMQRGAL
jgi:hypothetical protein